MLPTARGAYRTPVPLEPGLVGSASLTVGDEDTAAALGSGLSQAQEKQLKSIGITLGSMGNPFFVALAKGAEAKAKQINPNVKVTALSADYDLNKQFSHRPLSWKT